MSRIKSSTLLMAEIYNENGVNGTVNFSSFYFNPSHSDKTPLLFADGRVETKLVGDVPPGPGRTWSFTPSSYTQEAQNFYGLYLLQYYAVPASVNW